jgi:hypothetical protein
MVLAETEKHTKEMLTISVGQIVRNGLGTPIAP